MKLVSVRLDFSSVMSSLRATPLLSNLLPRLIHGAVEEVEWFATRRVLADIATSLPPHSLARSRTALFKAAGVKIGRRSLVMGRMRLTGIGNPCDLLTIGDSVFITGGLHVDLGAPVHIGDETRIGHDVSLLTINHDLDDPENRAGVSYARGIDIGKGCWLASRCMVLPGVTIGQGCVIAAGAVVTRDVLPNMLVAGVPARVIRDLGDQVRSPQSRARLSVEAQVG